MKERTHVGLHNVCILAEKN